MFDVVYAWLPESGVEQVGHNYAVYDQFSRDGMRMQVGFPVSRRFADGAQVKCVELPAGRAAHTRHQGAYSGLPEAHRRLNQWCAKQPLDLAGVSWEVYGDWEQDESRLVTDVYVRLA
jgi:effector-binding domain-containing protein